MCELYYRFGSFLIPLSIGLIKSRHYLLEQNIAGTKNDGTNRHEEEMSEWLATRSKYTGLGAAMAADLMIGFWFSILRSFKAWRFFKGTKTNNATVLPHLSKVLSETKAAHLF